MVVPAPIRLVALDLDGTALNSAGVLTPRTESSLRRITAESVQVAAATGRSPSIGLRQICRKELFRWAVCSNGASLHDVERDALVSATTIPEPALSELIDQVTATLPRAVLAWGTASQIHWTPGFASIYGSMLDEQRIMADGTRRPAGVVKVLVGDGYLDGTELAGLLTERLGRSLRLTSSNLGYVEIVAFGVTKAARLAELCRRLSISACEVVAFGDGFNDLEMLQWAGHSYAMIGAHPTVSAAARHRTRFSNDEDGVADVLDELFPPGESVR
jgi:hydroxymethylpyrimidine pyrophosphatase-like HAD family hydrolase